MSTSHPETPQHWVAAWYAAPSRTLSPGLTGRTLRQIVHVRAGGQQLRLRLSNRYGDGPVTLAAISIARVLQGPEIREDSAQVMFSGNTTVKLEPGQEKVSDSVTMNVDASSALAVTFFLAEGDCITGHLTAQQTSYVSGTRDVSSAPGGMAFIVYPLSTSSWWLLTGVDVIPPKPLNAVVAFGSSTTDGVGSTPNTNRRWPDYLARRLEEADDIQHMSVINAGLSGNQLTASELPQLANTGMPEFLMGEAGQKRFAWDVVPQPGATDLILNIGSNDLRAGVKAVTLIEAFKDIVQKARRIYKRVFGTTILPGGYTREQGEQYQLVNNWMLEHGNQWFDAVFDFATPLRADTDKTMLNPKLHCGDGMHPNDDGYRLIAEAIDISQLSGSPIRG